MDSKTIQAAQVIHRGATMKWPRFNSARHGKAPLHLPTIIEILPEGVSAAAFVEAEPAPRTAFEVLSEAQHPSESPGQQLQEAASITNAVRKLLVDLAPSAHHVALLIPDLDVHAHLLEFDSLPESRHLADPIVRMRLKRITRINVDSAKVSFEVVAKNHGSCKVFVLCVENNVLEKYEGAVNMAGVRPGIVLPSGVALLRSLKEKEPVLLAYVTAASMTTCICSAEDLCLYRTIDLRSNRENRCSEINHALSVAVAYFEDTFEHTPENIHLAISDDSRDLIASSPDLPIVQLPNAAVGMALAFASSAARSRKWN
jgi:hypothetical protein